MIRKPWFFLLAPALLAGLAGCSKAKPTPVEMRGYGTPVKTPVQWTNPPPMIIDRTKIYIADFQTVKGEFRVQLFADKAPFTVNSFVFLARQGFYNNTTFHRVIKDFMAQGGDPTGTGSGGPGYSFDDELSPDLKFDKPGMMAMANSGSNTNGSQFFITFSPQTALDGRYTIFGEVVSGLDVVQSLKLRDPSTSPNFTGDAIYSVTISESPISLLPGPTATATLHVPVPTKGARPLATMSVTARANLFTGPPAMVIDITHSYQAVFDTTRGKLVFELDAADAPQSVNNFVVLAQMGFWDNFPINYAQRHDFLLTGEPSGLQDSDIGYTLPYEKGYSNAAGSLGYWISTGGTASSGSQLYILLVNHTELDGKNTAFGRLIGKDSLVLANQFTTDDRILTVTILDTIPTPTPTLTPTPTTQTQTQTQTQTKTS
jgi:cyclophilin family peptidyl-prolyl cis-trans isomerase